MQDQCMKIVVFPSLVNLNLIIHSFSDQTDKSQLAQTQSHSMSGVQVTYASKAADGQESSRFCAFNTWDINNQYEYGIRRSKLASGLHQAENSSSCSVLREPLSLSCQYRKPNSSSYQDINPDKQSYRLSQWRDHQWELKFGSVQLANGSACTWSCSY